MYCTANSIEDGDKQKAVFLTSIGGTTYTLLKNLVRPRLPQDLELEALIDVLKRHYQPNVVVIAERFKFFKRQQREGESIAVYLSELRRLAKDCEFGEYLTCQPSSVKMREFAGKNAGERGSFKIFGHAYNSINISKFIS